VGEAALPGWDTEEEHRAAYDAEPKPWQGGGRRGSCVAMLASPRTKVRQAGEELFQAADLDGCAGMTLAEVTDLTRSLLASPGLSAVLGSAILRKVLGTPDHRLYTPASEAEVRDAADWWGWRRRGGWCTRTGPRRGIPFLLWSWWRRLWGTL